MSANLPALQRTVFDLVKEYEEKSANIAQAIADYDAAFDRLGMSATVQGCFVEPVGSKSYLSEKSLQKNLLASGWRAIYNRLDIASIATAKDKQLFDRTLADPPPLTFDNAKATFRDCASISCAAWRKSLPTSTPPINRTARCGSGSRVCRSASFSVDGAATATMPATSSGTS